MKTLFSKVINKFTLGLYIALANSIAFADGIMGPAPAPVGGSGFGFSTGGIALAILAAAGIGGIIALFSGNDDDDDNFIFS